MTVGSKPINAVVIAWALLALVGGLAGCAHLGGDESGVAMSRGGPYSPEDEALYLARYRQFVETAPSGGGVGDYDPLEPVAGASEPTQIAAAPAVTLSPAALAAARSYAAEHNSSALLVWRDGRLEEESYFDGFNRDTPIVSKSLAKPVTALLIGRAIRQGFIKSLDQPVGDFIAEWRGDPQRSKITIRNMLAMETGLQAQALSGGPEEMLFRAYLHPRHDQIIIHDYPMTDEPGTRYEYSNANADLVAPVIERATGKRYAEYLSEALLEPIGAAGGSVWVNRPGGTAHSGCCLLLPAQSWLKMAILLIDDGVWNGKRLLPKDYVEEMRTGSAPNPHYGLGIWLGGSYLERRGYANPDSPAAKVLHSEPYLDKQLFLFDGNSNQVVYIIPSERMIILRTGANPPKDREWDNAYLPNLLIRDANRAPGSIWPEPQPW